MNRQGFLILSYVTLASFASTIISAGLPDIGIHFSIDRTDLDWIMTLYLIGFASGQLLYGPLANLLGRVGSLRFGILIHLVGLALGLLSFGIDNYPLLLISRFITALGGASGLVCAFVLINETFERSVVKILIPYIGLFFSVSVVISIFIGGVISQYIGIAYCLVFNMLHAVIMLLFTKKIKETLDKSHKQDSFKDSKLSLFSPALRNTIALSVGASLLPIFTYTYSVSIPLFAEKTLGLEDAAYGLWNLINLIGMLVCSLITGKVCLKIGTTKTGMIGYFCFASGVILLLALQLLAPTSRLLLFIITSYLYFSAGVAASCSAIYASNALRDKAIASSILNFTTLSLGSLSLMFLGFIALKTLPAFICTLAVFLALSFTFFILAEKNENPIY